MFTWICPQCGREVPPAYNECPDCSGKTAAQSAPQQPPAQPPPPPQYGAPPQYTSPPRQYAPPPQQYTTPPQQYAAPPQQAYAPPPQQQYSAPPPQQYGAPPPSFAAASPYAQQPPQRAGMPAWAMSIVFAIGFLAIFAAAFFGIRYFSSSGQAAAPTANAPIALENPSAKTLAKPNALQKYVEVVGLRLTEDAKKKPQVRFLVVNHSGAEMSDLAANVNLWARTQKSDEEAVGTFSFKLPSLGPYESKDVSAALNTKLKVYELPDWQNLTAEVQITSPQE